MFPIRSPMDDATKHHTKATTIRRIDFDASVRLLVLSLCALLFWRCGGDAMPGHGQDDATPRATLPSGQVIEGDFEILTIEDIWAKGDIVAAMSVAIERDPVWLRRLLDDEGIDPNLRLTYGSGTGWAHPLEKAARQGSQETFEILLAAGADPNGRSSDGSTALHVAARKHLHAIMAQLLDAGANPNQGTNHDGTPIEFAARYGNPEGLETLLAAGVELRFALHAAADRGDVEIIRRLLDLGADPTRLTPHGDSVLRGSAKDENLEASRMLLAAGAKPCAQSLRNAARGGHLETLRLFADAGVRFERPPEAWDPLYSAAHAGQSEAVALLLSLGASPHGATALDSPIDAAIAKGHDHVVEVLIAAGARAPVEAKPERP